MTRPRIPLVRLVALLLLVTLVGCAALSLLQSVDALMRQGRELLAAGRYDEALAKFQEVIRRDPKFWSAYLESARAHIGKGAWTDAIARGRQAWELAPAKPDVVPVFAEALLGGGTDALRRGQYPEAIGHLTEYVRLRPTDPRGYLELGRASLASGALGPALGAFVDGLRHAGSTATRGDLEQALLDGGMQALGRGDAGAAIGFLREAVALDPGNVSAHLNLGRAYARAGEAGEALRAFRRVLELSPGHGEALQFLRGGR